MGIAFYVLLGYLSGSLLWANFFGNLLAGEDVAADSPDGNPGAFNAFRYGGFWCGCLTLCFDVCKGFFPVRLFCRSAALMPSIGLALVLAAPVIGHTHSVFHGFRGGKGIAVSFGCLLGLAPELKPLLVLAAVFILFSTVIEVSPHYYRTLATYIAAIPAMFLAVRSWAVRGGFLLIAQTIISKLLGSKEEKDKLEVKVGWKS